MFKPILSLLLLFRTGTDLSMSAQPHDFVTFGRGDPVTLHCSLPQGHDNYFSWFRQAVGRPPLCMLTMYAHSQEATFYGEFRNDPRFSARRTGTALSLTISNPRPEDAGMYYCAARDYELMVFGGGTFLTYKGEETRNRHFIQQPVSQPVQPGDSVTLQCTIHTETCAGEHSVYWFRQGSGESSPGIIYTHGNSSDQCERSSGAGSPTQSCVYKLPKRNLSLSDAGTYYCAVATCGEILFGNGTSVEILGSDENVAIDPLVATLAASNMLCVIVIAVLLCVKHKRTPTSSGDTYQQSLQGHTEFPSSTEQSRHPEQLNYVALNFSRKKTKTREQTGDTDTHVVYSGLRC